MDFILSQNNLLILAIAVLAGIMLLIPSFFKGRAGRAVSSSEAVQMVNQKDAILIDLRSADQFKAGAIAQSRNIPAADLDAKAGTLPKDKPVILVCDTGRSAPRSVAVLRKHGITEAYTLQGGIQGWLQSSLPVKKS
ncbi:rhodanese-like domain-containing protein [Alcaligenes faecalis]|uniref:Rhodanese-like domain-containing protein n=4 Tax=cellular organisms TaxID=131567 RepID=A0A0M7FHZ1_ALCFA|nr:MULTISPECIES: rhodanese-like domain-containing protein [Alcaligenes]AWG36424.1 rhodanese-like domain-containing protein [Alcaligenes aquatilis]ALO39104.1 rhodanese [Alcaligenes faecalis]ATI00980.1 rhodanese-like domain-containing protein [Alcaligenes faecalis]AYZ90339.1 rhodanese-like domain-containing protein [Alcaligenes faecalis]KAA1287974.1 rhodanese-like domain-containing protein [Alcaligenes faecalis]